MRNKNVQVREDSLASSCSALLTLTRQLGRTQSLSSSSDVMSPSSLPLPVCVCRPEAAEVGGSARRLDPRPRRQDAAQEEDHVPEEEDHVQPGEGGRKDVREEEEVAGNSAVGGTSVLFGGPSLVVLLPDTVVPRPLVGLVVNWEETEQEVGDGGRRLKTLERFAVPFFCLPFFTSLIQNRISLCYIQRTGIKVINIF